MSREIMEHALEALMLVGKYTDSLTCYVSTISEHEANIVDPSVQLAIAALEAELAKPVQDTRLKVKLGRQYGYDLNGHWFYLQPADEYAEAAIAKATGEQA